MPELPEVETVRQGLAPWLVDRPIANVVAHRPNLRFPIPPLAQYLTGQPITALTRRGKYLLATSPRGQMLMHLGMSGSFLTDDSLPGDKHDHLHITFADQGRSVRYRDPRRFGFVLWYGLDEAPPALARLGVEPWPSPVDAAWLYTQLQKRKGPIKPALLDQAFIAGLGNIYVSESLFLSGVDPRRACNRVTRDESAALAQHMTAVLDKAIAAGGSSLRNHRDTGGHLGCFQHQFQVYDRHDQPCYTCGTPIEKITQAGRSTFFCPTCQPCRD